MDEPFHDHVLLREFCGLQWGCELRPAESMNHSRALRICCAVPSPILEPKSQVRFKFSYWQGSYSALNFALTLPVGCVTSFSL